MSDTMANSAESPGTPQPHERLRELDFFLGAWDAPGVFHETPFRPRAPIRMRIVGTSEGRGFWRMVRTTELPTPENPNPLTAIYVWGYDADSGEFVADWYDSNGGRASQRSRGWDGDRLEFSGSITTNGATVPLRDTFMRRGPDKPRHSQRYTYPSPGWQKQPPYNRHRSSDEHGAPDAATVSRAALYVRGRDARSLRAAAGMRVPRKFSRSFHVTTRDPGLCESVCSRVLGATRPGPRATNLRPPTPGATWHSVATGIFLYRCYSTCMGTRGRILEATTELLAEQGFGGTSTRAICQAAGITAPTLYHHFGTKDALFEAVVAEGLARFLEDKRGAISGDDPVENLRRGFDQYVAFAVSNPSLYAVILDRSNAEKLPKGAEEAYGMLTRLLSEAEKERGLRVGTELAAQAVWAAAHGVASLLVSRPGFGWDDALAATAREAAIGAVVADPRGGPTEGAPGTDAGALEESGTKEV